MEIPCMPPKELACYNYMEMYDIAVEFHNSFVDTFDLNPVAIVALNRLIELEQAQAVREAELRRYGATLDEAFRFYFYQKKQEEAA